jgi:hypothetical protein
MIECMANLGQGPYIYYEEKDMQRNPTLILSRRVVKRASGPFDRRKRTCNAIEEKDMQRNPTLILSRRVVKRASGPFDRRIWILRMRSEPKKGKADRFQCAGVMGAAILGELGREMIA